MIDCGIGGVNDACPVCGITSGSCLMNDVYRKLLGQLGTRSKVKEWGALYRAEYARLTRNPQGVYFSDATQEQP